VNSARSRRRIARVATVTVAATSMALGGALLASPAFADEENAFTLDIKDPAPVAPGADGVITYTLTNTSDNATDGFMIYISIPSGVNFDLDPNTCGETDHDPEGGEVVVRCNFDGGIGQFAAGESKVLEKSYTVAADAPEQTSLGELGANVVPIVNGDTTEDPTDIKGPHVDYTEITTSAASAGAWDQLKSFFGF
jgi:hypothetical protein